jgi:hypothetical protein
VQFQIECALFRAFGVNIRSTMDIAAVDVMTAGNNPVLATKSKLQQSGAKNNPRSGTWMARNLHLFAYFMKTARSTLRCTADEIFAQPEGRRALKKFLIFF